MRLLALALAIPLLLPAQGREWIRANYTKFEHYVPMRDGKRLFTSIYVPKDASAAWPIMLTRTPYSVAPYGADHYRASLGPSETFARDKFIFAYQDVRGRYMSEGQFVEMRPHKSSKNTSQDIDESSDTYDTVEWLIKNVPGNDGKVGQWGISYSGFYASAAMIDAHLAMKAVSPQAPVTDYYLGDDSYHNGAFFLAANFGFYSNFVDRKAGPERPQPGPRFDFKTPDGYQFYLEMGSLAHGNELYAIGKNAFYTKMLEHPNYDDYWKQRSIWRYFKDIKPAVLTVGGWFDAEDLQGPLRTCRVIKESQPASYNGLVMGPWTHGGFARTPGDRVGNVNFGSKTAEYYREKIEYPFFAYFLKGKGDGKFACAYMFQTGTNQWRESASWPPPGESRTLYLDAGGTLGWSRPESAEAFDEYISDPAHPVPYLGYIAQGMSSDYMTEDQRFAAQRPDVLVYRTGPLDEDISAAGPIHVELHVSTTGTDADFVVKLIDVYPDDFPDNLNAPTPPPATPAPRTPRVPPPANAVRMGGYQQLVRGEPFRGRFRHSFEKPAPFIPGKVEKIVFAMPDICHVFRRGHRIMVQVQSSWFPLVDRNPQRFVHIPTAKPDDFTKATQRVYRSRTRSTSVSFISPRL